MIGWPTESYDSRCKLHPLAAEEHVWARSQFCSWSAVLDDPTSQSVFGAEAWSCGMKMYSSFYIGFVVQAELYFVSMPVLYIVHLVHCIRKTFIYSAVIGCVWDLVDLVVFCVLFYVEWLWLVRCPAIEFLPSTWLWALDTHVCVRGSLHKVVSEHYRAIELSCCHSLPLIAGTFNLSRFIGTLLYLEQFSATGFLVMCDDAID